jgi:tRNA splicing endonuclease
MSESTLVSRCRLGTAVKKTVLFAYLTDVGEIKYRALRWTGRT